MAFLLSMLGAGGAAGAGASTGGLTALGTGASAATLPTVAGSAGSGLTIGSGLMGSAGSGAGLTMPSILGGGAGASSGLASIPELSSAMYDYGTSGMTGNWLKDSLAMKDKVESNPYYRVGKMLEGDGKKPDFVNSSSTSVQPVQRRQVRMFR